MRAGKEAEVGMQGSFRPVSMKARIQLIWFSRLRRSPGTVRSEFHYLGSTMGSSTGYYVSLSSSSRSESLDRKREVCFSSSNGRGTE